MFKVVTDQLKVSQGWVRCGHCADVFDASLHLQTALQPAAPWPEASAVNTVETENQGPGEPLVAVMAEPLLSAQPALESADEAPFSAAIALVDSSEADRTKPVSGLLQEVPDDDVSFVRDARRQAFWRKPAVRLALLLFALLLAVFLLLQALTQQRDALVAMEPRLKPWLQMLCQPLHCQIAPLRHIEAVVIDSSSFNKLGSDSYRLGFTLKNTGSIPVAMPSLEVTLTDIQEQALVRRVVSPAQFGATDGGSLLGVRSDFSGVVVLQVLG